MSISTGEELTLKEEGSDSDSDGEGDRPKKKTGGEEWGTPLLRLALNFQTLDKLEREKG